ncbi:MAG: sulfite exporter TauE/SafE family protein [Planctomycetes bacterium]|nr:sulfite exporter TauE/SafE family protein [Planctomycetota bacterium]
MCATTAFFALTFIPPTADDPVRFMLLASLAAAIFGATKAGFGGGLGMVSTPLMIYACGDPPTALAIMLPLLITADYVTAAMWWRQWDGRNVLALLPGALAGIAAGGAVLALFRHLGAEAGKELTGAALALAIGLLATGFVALHVVRAVRGGIAVFRPGRAHALGFGAAAGLSSTLAHAAGPVTQMYLLPQQMPKGRYVATTVLFYWIINQAKLVPYFALKMVSTGTLGADLVLLPAVVVGALAGLALHRRINTVWFNRLVYGLLGVIGLHLAITSAMALFGG